MQTGERRVALVSESGARRYNHTIGGEKGFTRHDTFTAGEFQLRQYENKYLYIPIYIYTIYTLTVHFNVFKISTQPFMYAHNTQTINTIIIKPPARICMVKSHFVKR